MDDPKFIENVETIIKEYPNPEEINDNPQTAPSKRLLKIKSGYDKIFHGNMIALDNGIELPIEKCPHFSAWVRWMKSLVHSPTFT